MSIARLLKSVFYLILFLIISLVALVYGLSVYDRAIDYDVSLGDTAVPEFSPQQIDFVPAYDKALTLPFTAGAVIDIDSDGIDELFFGDGIDQ